MTLLDLCRLLKRYVALVVAIPLVCALGCFAYLSMAKPNEATYTATSRIVVSTHLQDANGLTNSVARTVMATNKGTTVKASIDSNTKTVSIVVTSSDRQQAIDVANEVAENASLQCMEFIPANAEDPFNARVEAANNATVSSNTWEKIKIVFFAMLAGLFIAIVLVVVIDMIKHPVKSVEGAQSAVELPVLEVMPIKDDGERLLANVRFASKEDNLRSICVIPVGSGSAAADVADALFCAAKNEGLDVRFDSAPLANADLTVIPCESLSQGMKAAYVARKTDSAVLVVRQWADSMRDLESAVAELKLAEVRLVGIVFAKKAK